MTPLTKSVLQFLEQLDLVFNTDEAHTESLDFHIIRDALLGRYPSSARHSCHNAETLSHYSQELRQRVAISVAEELQHWYRSDDKAS